MYVHAYPSQQVLYNQLHLEQPSNFRENNTLVEDFPAGYQKMVGLAGIQEVSVESISVSYSVCLPNTLSTWFFLFYKIYKADGYSLQKYGYICINITCAIHPLNHNEWTRTVSE